MSGEQDAAAAQATSSRHLVLAILVDETLASCPPMRQFILWLAAEKYSLGLISRATADPAYDDLAILDLLLEISAAGGIGLSTKWRIEEQNNITDMIADLVDAFGRVDGILLTGKSVVPDGQKGQFRQIPMISIEFNTEKRDLGKEPFMQSTSDSHSTWRLRLPVITGPMNSPDMIRQKAIDAISTICATKK